MGKWRRHFQECVQVVRFLTFEILPAMSVGRESVENFKRQWKRERRRRVTTFLTSF